MRTKPHLCLILVLASSVVAGCATEKVIAPKIKPACQNQIKNQLSNPNWMAFTKSEAIVWATNTLRFGPDTASGKQVSTAIQEPLDVDLKTIKIGSGMTKTGEPYQLVVQSELVYIRSTDIADQKPKEALSVSVSKTNCSFQ